MAPQDAPTGHPPARFREQSGVASPDNHSIHIGAWIGTFSSGGGP